MEETSVTRPESGIALRIKLLDTGFIECCACLECKDTSVFLAAYKFKGIDSLFFRVDEYDSTISYYRSTRINRPYHSGYSISLEDVLELVNPDVQIHILFHLDLFRGKI